MVEFREESRRSASPEQLGSYIKVSRPSVWLLLCAIAVLLAAGVAWFFAGTIHETARGTAVAAQDGSVVAYLSLEDSAAVAAGDPATLQADGTTVDAVVLEFCGEPVSRSRVQEECGGQQAPDELEDSWYAAVRLQADAAPGVYSVAIVTASHRPVMLLLGLA
ncbi:MAG: hypothetical protein ACI36W_07220 [Coriobacteriales bacterium]